MFGNQLGTKTVQKKIPGALLVSMFYEKRSSILFFFFFLKSRLRKYEGNFCNALFVNY